LPARIKGDNIFTLVAINQYDALCFFSKCGSAVDFAGPGKKYSHSTVVEASLLLAEDYRTFP
jgi:hypothetical protein